MKARTGSLLVCPLSCPSPMRAVASHCLRYAEHMFFVQQQQAHEAQCCTTEAYLQLRTTTWTYRYNNQSEKRLTLLLSRILQGPVLALRSKEYLRCYQNIKWRLNVRIPRNSRPPKIYCYRSPAVDIIYIINYI